MSKKQVPGFLILNNLTLIHRSASQVKIPT